MYLYAIGFLVAVGFFTECDKNEEKGFGKQISILFASLMWPIALGGYLYQKLEENGSVKEEE